MSINYLPKTQEKALKSTQENPRNAAIIHLFLNTGIFPTELINLKNSSINWEQSELTIEGTRPRKLPINQETFNLLAIWSKKNPQKQSQYFFTPLRKRNDQITIRAVDVVIRKAAQKANLPKTTNFKILRNTFAVNLCKQKISTKQAMKILGLKSPDCARRYFPKKSPEKPNKKDNK